MRHDKRPYQNQSQCCAKAPGRDAVDTGADDCRCLEHGRDLPLVFSRWSSNRRSQSTIFRAVHAGGKSFPSALQPIVKPLRNLAHNCGLTRHAISSTQICDAARPLARLSRWWAVSGIQTLAAPFSEAPSRAIRCFRMGICRERCPGADCRNIDRQRVSPNHRHG